MVDASAGKEHEYDTTTSHSEWEAAVPIQQLEPGMYDIILETEVPGRIVREHLTNPSDNLLQRRLGLEKPHFAYNREFRILFSGSEHIKASLQLKLFVSDASPLARNSSRSEDINHQPMGLVNVRQRFVQQVFRGIYGIFKLFPINPNKVVFATYKTTLEGNLAAIHEQIALRTDVKCILLLGNDKSHLQWLRLAWHVATASNVVVDDYYRFFYYLNHRGKTKFIQTWHGPGIFKRFAMLAVEKSDSNSEQYEKIAHAYYTHVLVSDTSLVDPYAEAFHLSREKIIPIGIPRTDIFFDAQKKNDGISKLYSLFPEIRGKKIILYAPTFRGAPSERTVFTNKLDFEQFKVLFDRDYILLYKTHPLVEASIEIPERYKNVILDMSKYPDINELFFITDILITDYSSSVFEFALLGKPIISFAYDLDSYVDERGFYYDIEELIPGPIFTTTEQVVDYVQKLTILETDHSAFLNRFMNRIDGHSTERLIQLMFDENTKGR